MKTKKILWAVLSMAAALVMTACSSDNDVTETPSTPSTPTTKTIPYTVTVTDGSTRATVDADYKTLRFAAGDKLYITGTNIQGVLNLQAGDEGKTSDATFSGDLTYLGSGSPAADHPLTATLVSAQQTVGTQVSVDGAGAVTVNYPTTSYCTSVNDAVQQYSRLTGTSTYGARAFSLTQQTAFLNFVITFGDGTTSGTTLAAVVKNGGAAICTANVTTTTEEAKVVAKFVLPVAASTTLSSASVKMGSKASVSFGASQTLTGKVYNVKKVQPVPPAAVGAVDLGLPSGTLWANMNVGATAPEGFGDYFAWGETEPYYLPGYAQSESGVAQWRSGKENGYVWGSYKWCNGSETTLTKYCGNSVMGYNGYTDDRTALEAEDDAATVNWGAEWCMPSSVQFQELKDNTTQEDTKLNGVSGYLFKSKINGNSIFFPNAGYRGHGSEDDGTLYFTGNSHYWMSSYDRDYPQYACFMAGIFLYINSFSNKRTDGFPVRPVRKN